MFWKATKEIFMLVKQPDYSDDLMSIKLAEEAQILLG